jgi:hypothetical protein
MDGTNLRDLVISSPRLFGCGCNLLARLLGNGLSIDRVNGEGTRKIVGKPTILDNKIKV